MDRDKIDDRLINAYIDRRDAFESLFPYAVNRYRTPAIESFKFLGLPDKSNEKYKCTDIQSVFQQKYKDFELSLCGEETGETTQNDCGAIHGSLPAFAQEYPALVSKYYNTLADNDNDGVTALNTAFVSGGRCIYVPEGVTVDEPFTIHVKGWCEEEGKMIVGRRDLFIFEKGTRAKIAVRFDKRAGLVNRVCEIFIEEGADVELVEMHTAKNSEEGVCVNSVYVNMAKESRYQSTVVLLGGKAVRNNQTVTLNGRGASCRLFGTTVAGGNRHMDNYTDIRHLSSDAASHEHFKSVVDDKAVSSFNGRIYVAPHAQRTHAFQQNNNLLLGDSARVYSKPQLEIYADDVKCSHGATTGRLDAEAVFYMRQRGISPKEARRLQLTGFISDLTNRIGMKTVRQEVNEYVEDMITRL